MEYESLFAEFSNNISNYEPIATPDNVDAEPELLLIDTSLCADCNVSLDDDDVCPKCGLGRVVINDTANYILYSKLPTLGKTTETLIAITDCTRDLGISPSIVKKAIDKCIVAADRSTNMRAQIAVGIIIAMYKRRIYIDAGALITAIKARSSYSATLNMMYIYNPAICIERQRRHNQMFPELLAEFIASKLTDDTLTANVNIAPKVKGQRPMIYIYPPQYANRSKLLLDIVLWFFHSFKTALIGQTRKTRTQICALFSHIGRCLYGVDTRPRRFVKITDITINAYINNIRAYVELFWPFAMEEFNITAALPRNVKFMPMA
jgi:hypothetical protein